MIILAENVLEVECVISTVAGTDVSDHYMVTKLEFSLSLDHNDPSLSQPQHQLTKTNQERQEVPQSRNDKALANRTQEQGSGHTTEGDANTNSTLLKIQEAEKVALRTVPIILKHGKRRLLVICFLDEGSDTAYVNEDEVEELGVKGEKELITVNVANDHQVSFPSNVFFFGNLLIFFATTQYST